MGTRGRGREESEHPLGGSEQRVWLCECSQLPRVQPIQWIAWVRSERSSRACPAAPQGPAQGCSHLSTEPVPAGAARCVTSSCSRFVKTEPQPGTQKYLVMYLGTVRPHGTIKQQLGLPSCSFVPWEPYADPTGSAYLRNGSLPDSNT